MRFLRPTTCIAAGVAALALSALPLVASADASKSLYLNGSRLGYGGVTNNKTRIYSCDTLADGDGFRAEYKLKNGHRGYVDDANGSKSGCSDTDNVGTSSNPIAYFRVISKQGSDTDNWLYSDWIKAA